MNIPKLKQGCYSIIRAESSTGIIFNNDDTYYQSSGEDFYLTFNSLLEAKDYIKTSRSTSNIKCDYSIYDYSGAFVEIIRG